MTKTIAIGRRPTGRDRDDEGRYADAADRLKAAGPADGLATPKVTPKRRVAAGKAAATGTAAGMAIPRDIRRRRVGAGIIRATAKAVGTGIRKATRKRHAGVGKAAKAGARPATRSVLSATTRCSPAAGRGLTMIATTAAAMTTTAAMAAEARAGRAIRRAIRKLRGAAGKTVVNRPASAVPSGAAKRKLGRFLRQIWR